MANSGWRIVGIGLIGAVVIGALFVLFAFMMGIPTTGTRPVETFGTAVAFPTWTTQSFVVNATGDAVDQGLLTVSMIGNTVTLVLQGVFTLTGDASAIIFQTAGFVPLDALPVSPFFTAPITFPITLLSEALGILQATLMIFVDGTAIVLPVYTDPVTLLTFATNFAYPPFTIGDLILIEMSGVAYMNTTVTGPNATLVEIAAANFEDAKAAMLGALPRTSADLPAYLAALRARRGRPSGVPVPSR